MRFFSYISLCVLVTSNSSLSQVSRLQSPGGLPGVSRSNSKLIFEFVPGAVSRLRRLPGERASYFRVRDPPSEFKIDFEFVLGMLRADKQTCDDRDPIRTVGAPWSPPFEFKIDFEFVPGAVGRLRRLPGEHASYFRVLTPSVRIQNQF